MARYSPFGDDAEQALNNPTIRSMVEGVRLFLRDYADLNRLTEGEDHSDRHIYWSILLTLSDWATTPPFVGQNDINLIVDRGWFALFLQGVVIKLLESLGILHMRNYLAYSDGGVNLQTENPQMIQAWLTMFKNEYEQKKQRALIALNIESALSMGGLHSELLYVNSFFGAW
jgi:hypothetical protein